MMRWLDLWWVGIWVRIRVACMYIGRWSRSILRAIGRVDGRGHSFIGFD